MKLQLRNEGIPGHMNIEDRRCCSGAVERELKWGVQMNLYLVQSTSYFLEGKPSLACGARLLQFTSAGRRQKNIVPGSMQ